jgi:hypothetical protein
MLTETRNSMFVMWLLIAALVATLIISAVILHAVNPAFRGFIDGIVIPATPSHF